MSATSRPFSHHDPIAVGKFCEPNGGIPSTYLGIIILLITNGKYYANPLRLTSMSPAVAHHKVVDCNSTRLHVLQSLIYVQAQTPQQRRANAKFDRFNEKKMGKPESVYKKKELPKSPVNRIWLGKPESTF